MPRVRQESSAAHGRTNIGERYKDQCLCSALLASLCSAPRTGSDFFFVPCVSRRPPTGILTDCTLEIYARGFGVHRYSVIAYGGELVHSPESFQVSEVSLHVYWVYPITRDPRMARATSSTTVRLSGIMVVQMLASA